MRLPTGWSDHVQSCRSINVLSEPPLAAAVAHGIWSLVGHKAAACAVDMVGQHGVADGVVLPWWGDLELPAACPITPQDQWVVQPLLVAGVALK
ncbi:hypothetical protein H257_06488 [Aphanomyces astaci]|uniref:Uncharacterized protein n=1 Tax=Aphanomyces astaci TaxID=112090 RepID=W4GMI5_APHAT|nr:hypothetical protein H257_06488 [Aphanomyces astaci]ETV80093.1 hypothetical protein H257_06488 [Aphanomyces astaci]|eukprot:XP_009830017.1 hypothetical protein H257_06488 [Aphanomyces astaci]